MKKIIILGNHGLIYAVLVWLILGNHIPAIACEACKKQQPKLLQGITHGPGPNGTWDYLITGIMVLITFYTLIISINCIIHPAEKGNHHIKRIILNN
jgi:hypothetical protein